MLPLTGLLVVVASVLGVVAVNSPWTSLHTTLNSAPTYMSSRLVAQMSLGPTFQLAFELPSMGYLAATATCTVEGGFVSQSCSDTRDEQQCQEQISPNVGQHMCAVVGLLFPCGKAYHDTTSLRELNRLQAAVGWNMTAMSPISLDGMACDARDVTSSLIVLSCAFAFLGLVCAAVLILHRFTRSFSPQHTLVATALMSLCMCASTLVVTGALIEYYSNVIDPGQPYVQHELGFIVACAMFVADLLSAVCSGVVFLQHRRRSRTPQNESQSKSEEMASIGGPMAFRALKEDD